MPAWAPLATGAALIGTTTAALGGAAHLSGPGAAFYGLKRQVERIPGGLQVAV